jgi:hypothetical protein
MKYEKPQVVVAASALDSIETSMKPHVGVVDSELDRGYTATAYEADE